MRAPRPYVVPIRELPTERSFEIPASFVATAVAGMPMREALEPPADGSDAGAGKATLSLYADGDGDGDHVFATGHIKGHVRVACSRCIEPVDVAFDEKLLVTFMPAADMPTEDDDEDGGKGDGKGDDDGVEVGAGDLDLFPYDNEEIDLEPLLREQFVLAVPFAPLCKEACAGLCPQCGKNRNQGPCACESPGDPRFAALRSLKLPS